MMLIKLLAISLMMSSCAAWTILVIAPFPIVSHWTYMETVIKELLNVGHTIISISYFSLTFEHEKYYEYTIEEMPDDVYCKNFYFSNILAII
jgi:hypothetical protein